MAEFTMLLGADRGDPGAMFGRAATLIGERIGRIVAASRDHWTEAWGFQDEHLFLNRALLVESAMAPADVMDALLRIERELGRERPAAGGYGPRTIDLDILFVGEETLDLPNLKVPHPRVHLRAFALGPAADIVPGLRHPQQGRTVLQLLNHVMGQA